MRQSLSFSWLLLFSAVVVISSYFHYGFLQPSHTSSNRVTTASRSALCEVLRTIIRFDVKFAYRNVIVRGSRSDDAPFSTDIDRIGEHSSGLIGDDDPYMQSLNAVQRSIVSADLRNIRVQAGPGSGKTR